MDNKDNKKIKHMFYCYSCETIMTIYSSVPKERLHTVPPCPCGKSRMVDMSSSEYAYGIKPGWPS
jgi:hypothetical protein